MSLVLSTRQYRYLGFKDGLSGRLSHFVLPVLALSFKQEFFFFATLQAECFVIAVAFFPRFFFLATGFPGKVRFGGLISRSNHYGRCRCGSDTCQTFT